MWKRLIQRILNVFKANVNDAIDSVEDPVKMMKLAIAEMELSINKSTTALSKAMGNHKTLQKQSEQYKLESESWLNKATYAIKSGQDDLAKKALEKKALAEKQYEQYNALAQNAALSVEQLKEQLDRMKGKLAEAKAKESILTAKLSTAQAQKEIAEQLGGTNYSPLAEFNKYEKQILEVEAESEAMVDLVSNNNKLEKEFDELETNATVMSDFEKLKAQLQQKESKDIIDININDIKKIDNNNNNIIDNTGLHPENQKKIDDFFKNNQ